MTIQVTSDLSNLRYVPGLSKVEEAVISSHFMEELANDEALQLYGGEQLRSSQWEMDSSQLEDELIPLLLHVSSEFARQRAELALPRARQHFAKYGLAHPDAVSIEHEIAEALFDKQFLRGPRETCSREEIAAKIGSLVRERNTIRLVIPALPFKFSSPLKSRGMHPDFGEVNFLLSLMEIVRTVEFIYRKVRATSETPMIQFIVISDGRRFNKFVGEPDLRLSLYREEIDSWIDRLKLRPHIVLVDYLETLCQRLPPRLIAEKRKIASNARQQYVEQMWPIFNPQNMAATLKRAAEVEPDPEANNPEGRFVTLLKSLVYTINYQSLKNFCKDEQNNTKISGFHLALYRELTTHLFHSYIGTNLDESTDVKCCGPALASRETLEHLRVQMLREVWQCTIEYLSEIKSDRELPADPILVAFPDCIRWTIHAKPGQLALLTAHALGVPIQCWAGTGTFRATKGGKIRLCTLPILALEGNGAYPVVLKGHQEDDVQPLFYVDKRIPATNIGELLILLKKSFTRQRTS